MKESRRKLPDHSTNLFTIAMARLPGRTPKANPSSSLSWLRFDNPDIPNHQSVASNRIDADQDEARCLKKRFPFALAALFPAGDSKHVEVAHQVAFQLRICMRDERRKNKFNDQQTAVLRNDRAAVLENRDSLLRPDDRAEHV